ncbi:helix-turn-helix domain-containing protein [Pseudomonas putida]|uniref:helix-turn-helix domain-containing protein n=1 Tax=Pseudomonas putida TaxID=303 RepID=UPI00081950A7|nr:helix-turn-helix transcriptional regulator [Pseudomonas putida]OCT29919.1 helix-turn-helix transcriptional regulator [Pseudomonas putida]OCT31617.1 helix-turn-helix transcriptional regulator [Pseudomonas putida]OCT33860.1 helix-turn-helix transcriptional regulator [Pseudomonas putida]OCT40305.1 helix-turn-helix transcriptional regulator [Pseudomonas putida]
MSSLQRAVRGRVRQARLPGMTQASPDTPLTLTLGALQQWHAALQGALSHSESPQALQHLAKALGQLVAVESMMISVESQGQAPRLLYQQGIPDAHRDAVLNRYFAAGYLLDPFCLAVQSGLAEGFYHLQDIAPDNFFDSDYYKAYYLGTGCSEDSYYIADLSDGRKLSLSLFQGCSGTRLSAQQIDLLRAVEPMVRELLGRYARYNLEPGSAPLEHASLQAAFDSFGCQVLTDREREVAHMILRGHSVKSTAQDLGISPETVRMHRKNLYLKLGINSQSELFARFIDWLRQG